MSPSRKLAGPRGSHRVTFSTVTRQSRRRTQPTAEWAQLGAGLAALGAHRLPDRCARAVAAAGGGRGVTAEDEEGIARWFGGVVDEAIRCGGLPAAVAIWTVLAGDSHAEPVGVRAAALPCDRRGAPAAPGLCVRAGRAGRGAGEPDEGRASRARGRVSREAARSGGGDGVHRQALRCRAGLDVYTAIASASEDDLRDLREDHRRRRARARGVPALGRRPRRRRPGRGGARGCALDADVSPAVELESGSGFADSACGFAGMVAEHALPPCSASARSRGSRASRFGLA